MTVKEFEGQFSRLYLPLGMYALRHVDDADAAEDMVQEAFMKVWVYVRDGGEIENFPAFMYRSVRNVCLNFLRGQTECLSEESIPEVDDEVIDTSFRAAAAVVTVAVISASAAIIYHSYHTQETESQSTEKISPGPTAMSPPEQAW